MGEGGDVKDCALCAEPPEPGAPRSYRASDRTACSSTGPPRQAQQLCVAPTTGKTPSAGFHRCEPIRVLHNHSTKSKNTRQGCFTYFLIQSVALLRNISIGKVNSENCSLVRNRESELCIPDIQTSRTFKFLQPTESSSLPQV